MVRGRPLSAMLSVAAFLAAFLGSPEVWPDPPPAASTTPPADRAPEIDAAAHAIASDRSLEGGSVGIAILDVDSARLLAAVNEHTAMNPASNAKLYTAGAALAMLHGNHRYETTLSGKLGADAVSDLALRGYGDPSLGTSDLWAMVDELKDYGVKRVQGDIRVDQRFYDEQTTPPAFDQQPSEWASFRAPVSAVALDEELHHDDRAVSVVAQGTTAHASSSDPPGFGGCRGDHTDRRLGRERTPWSSLFPAAARAWRRRWPVPSPRTPASCATPAAPRIRACSPGTPSARSSRERTFKVLGGSEAWPGGTVT